MQRALELAARGTGCTSPNPLVGCVVVRDGVTLGEGWHEVYGKSHAEVNAIRNAQSNVLASASGGCSIPEVGTISQTSQADNQQATRGATLYVTLEPCNHHGLTPPCTQAIVDAGIAHVIYALADPNPRAAGGSDWLQAQGVRVTTGVLEQQARFQNRFFFKHVATRQPYVIAKSATSLDGKLATRTGHSQWITGPEARQRSHQLRQALDAIIVGADTVIADDPSLTTRLPESWCAAELIRHPRPVVLDSTGRIALDAKLLSGALPTRTLIATTDLMGVKHRHILESRGFDVLTLPRNACGTGVDPLSVLDALGQRGTQSVLLEGGAAVHGCFRDARLIDEVWTFMAPTLIGGTDARTTFTGTGSDTLDDATELHDIQVETVGRDLLIRACVTQPVHSANNPTIAQPAMADTTNPTPE